MKRKLSVVAATVFFGIGMTPAAMASDYETCMKMCMDLERLWPFNGFDYCNWVCKE